ncbi:MAG: HTH-type transcriptional repressor NanR [Desulfovibrio sp.]
MTVPTKMSPAKSGLLTKSLANKSIVDRVVNRLTGAIINGELAPGDKIPTELELAESFEVGRNSVREAIKVLEAFGVLHIKRAEGTFVSSEFNKRMLDPMLYGLLLEKDSGAEIHDLRQVFDTGILNVAVHKASDASLSHIRQRLEDIRGIVNTPPVSAEALLAADVAFHAAIADSAENALISSVAGYIDRITIPSRIRTTQRIIEAGELDSFLHLHERMTDVLEKRDSTRIADTVTDHYHYWRQHISSYAG